MSTFLNIIIALIILSLIIIFHEFGHFIFARINGVTVNDFSLGMGPIIVSKTIKGTKFCIRAFPIGGACQMKGEDGNGSGQDEDSFSQKSIWQRFSIVFAGPAFNFILAFVLSLFIIGFGGYDPALVTYVKEGSNAESIGIQPGDTIKEIDGKTIAIGRDMLNYTYFNEITKDPIDIVIERGGEKKTLTLNPDATTSYFMGISYSAENEDSTVSVMQNYPAEEAGLREGDKIKEINGVKIETGKDLEQYFNDHPLTEEKLTVVYERNEKEHETTIQPKWATNYTLGFGYNTYRFKATAAQTLRYSFTEVRYWIGTTIHSLFYMITGHVHSEDVGGAVRVVSEISDTVEESKQDGTKYVVLNLIFWAILLTANLGVMNLLPIPALDGGRIFFMLIELIRGKPIPVEKEAIVHLIGFILLMLLMVFILYNDIKNVFFFAMPFVP